MTPEQKAAFINAQAVAATAEIEGMKAANYMSEINENIHEFRQEDFMAVINKYGIGANFISIFFNNKGCK